MTLADRLRQIVDALPPGAAVSLPRAAVEEWLSSEETLDHELDLERFAAVIGTSLSTARDYCAQGLVPGAYKRRGRKWFIPAASVPRFRAKQQELHGKDRANSVRKPARSRVLGRGRELDTSAWRNY